MLRYFWKDTPGLKADIERHRKEASELDQKILTLESKGTLNQMESRSLKAYRNFQYQLEVSKAEVVSKIGKNMKNKASKGFTLIEFLIVISIVGLTTVGIYDLLHPRHTEVDTYVCLK